MTQLRSFNKSEEAAKVAKATTPAKLASAASDMLTKAAEVRLQKRKTELQAAGSPSARLEPANKSDG